MHTDTKAHPVNYSKRVAYSADLTPIFPEYFPERRPHVSGVYMLHEDGRYYIGQSGDVFGCLLNYLSNPTVCGLMNPRGTLLASIPQRSEHTRKVVKARFIAAALSLDVPLTNKLTKFTRGKLLSLFPDLTAEREIIQKARGR
jgi:hypothetical protein